MLSQQDLRKNHHLPLCLNAVLARSTKKSSAHVSQCYPSKIYEKIIICLVVLMLSQQDLQKKSPSASVLMLSQQDPQKITICLYVLMLSQQEPQKNHHLPLCLNAVPARATKKSPSGSMS